MKIYIHRKGETYGSCDREAVEGFLKAGRLSPEARLIVSAFYFHRVLSKETKSSRSPSPSHPL
jgi:hypothetical protein